MNHQARTDLLAKVKAGTAHGGSVYAIVGIDAAKGLAAFHGSLDAAKALHEAVLPKWWWKVVSPDPHFVQVGFPNVGIYSGTSQSPARAWLIAIIEALIATTEETGT